MEIEIAMRIRWRCSTVPRFPVKIGPFLDDRGTNPVLGTLPRASMGTSLCQSASDDSLGDVSRARGYRSRLVSSVIRRKHKPSGTISDTS